MHHTQEQLDLIWDALKRSDPSSASELLERYTNDRMPGVYPRILDDDAAGHRLSVPTPDHPGRHVYVRRPGAPWSEER